MPLKYLADQPLAVRIVGWIHGLLFLAFVLSWQHTRVCARWPAARSRKVFIAALLPFGSFVIDRGIRDWEQEYLRDDDRR
jgi:integral membrane protein